MPTPLLVFAFLGLVVLGTVVAGRPRADPQPSPEWTPAEVIRIQVEALQHNDQPTMDAGIATAFRFASPDNQAATGPLPRFTEMVHGPGYRDMLSFERAEYGIIQVEDGLAVQEVTLVQSGGRRATFLFGLSRQSGGDCDGCWMTDAVVQKSQPADDVTRI